MWYPETQSKNYLNSALDLPATGHEQDWEIELADVDRIEGFIDFYEQSDLNPNEKKALVALILASFEEALQISDFDKRLWLKLVKIITYESFLFDDILSIWKSNDEEEAFAIAEYIRDI